MNPSTAGPASPQRPRPGKRAALLGVLIVILALGLGWFGVRGSWASAEERNPQSSAEGVLTQLHRTPEGRKQVRCAVVLDHPPEKVWSVITGYDRFTEVFPTVLSLKSSREPDGRHHLVFELDSIVGRWQVEVRVRHEESPERRSVTWDEPSGSISRNRGSWTLTPAGPGKTLLVYTLDVEVRGCPDVLVRNVLLSRQRTIVEGVIEALAKGR